MFIGSCTNGRIEDLRAAATVARGKKVAPKVRALVVPGSGKVRRDAEAKGLDKVFRDAGFVWGEAACSIGMVCASTALSAVNSSQLPLCPS